MCWSEAVFVYGGGGRRGLVYALGVGRPRATAGGRQDVVCTRLSAVELAELDRLRGSLSRSQFLRLLVKAAAKRGGV